MTEIAYFDERGNLTAHRDGYAMQHRQYNSVGNLTEITFFGVGGKPAISKTVIQQSA